MKFEYSEQQVLFKTENISLKFGDRLILRDINLEIKDVRRSNVKQGQIVSLLSTSGMGKTQFFNICSGILKPTTGQVLIGTDVLKPVAAGQVGVVAQSYPLFNQYTIEKNLMLAATHNKNIKENERQNKIDEVLNLFSLHDHINDYPCVLSGGQKQRIAIAQQILSSDHYLLLDEPFSGLDPIMVKKVCELILKVAGQNDLNTVIIITHDITTAAMLSDTLWILGHSKDTQGNKIPGATIQYIYDLKEIGVAWQYPDIKYDPTFISLVKEIEEKFTTL